MILANLLKALRQVKKPIDEIFESFVSKPEKIVKKTFTVASLEIDMREESYAYLTKMPMDSVTQEKVEALEKEFREIQEEVARLTAMTVEQMWIQELVALKKAI